MRDEESQQLSWSGEFVTATSLWSLLTVFLGVLLWAQVFSLPFLDELGFSDQSATVTLSYMVPLVALVPGALFRIPVLTLLIFPVCFIPGILMLPERNLLDLEQGFSMLRIGVSVAAYVAVAAAGAAKAQIPGRLDPRQLDPSQDESVERLDGVYPFYFAVRGAILVGLLLVVQYAAFQDPEIAAKIGRHYGERPEAAATFLGLLSFFAWCVAAYTMFFVPLMNFEYDVRKLSRVIDGLAADERRTHWRRIGIWALVASAAAAAWWFV